jgi:methionyl-tRNA formyltransferase
VSDGLVYLTNGARGVHCLRALLAAGEPVAGVIGHAGSEAGEAAEIARGAGLPYLAPESPNDDVVLEWTRPLGCRLAVMSGYARILRGRFISSFPGGVINLHGGPLPHYRGGSPLNWQILRGEPSIGISILFTNTGIDTGALLAEDRFEIGPDESIDSVVERSLPAFEKLLLGVLEGLRAGTLEPRPQSESGVRYFAKRLPQDGWIDWRTSTAKQVHDLVRALAGSYPGAFGFWRGDKIVLETTCLLGETIIGPPGRVLARRKAGVEVACADRALLVTEARTDDGSVLRANEVLPPRNATFDAAAPVDA